MAQRRRVEEGNGKFCSRRCYFLSTTDYTAEEDARLTELFKTHTEQQISEAMGRTVDSIRKRAARALKLTRPASFYLQDPKTVHLTYPKEMQEVIRLTKKLQKAINDANDKKSQ